MSNDEKIKKVKSGELSYLEFLKDSKEFENYKDWCNSHDVAVDEKSAEFYFDQTFPEYDETEVELEIYP